MIMQFHQNVHCLLFLLLLFQFSAQQLTVSSTNVINIKSLRITPINEEQLPICQVETLGEIRNVAGYLKICHNGIWKSVTEPPPIINSLRSVFYAQASTKLALDGRHYYSGFLRSRPGNYIAQNVEVDNQSITVPKEGMYYVAATMIDTSGTKSVYLTVGSKRSELMRGSFASDHTTLFAAEIIEIAANATELERSLSFDSEIEYDTFSLEVMVVYLRPSPGAVGAPSPDFALVGAINPPNVGVSAPVIEAVSATTFDVYQTVGADTSTGNHIMPQTGVYIYGSSGQRTTGNRLLHYVTLHDIADSQYLDLYPGGTPYDRVSRSSVAYLQKDEVLTHKYYTDADYIGINTVLLSGTDELDRFDCMQVVNTGSATDGLYATTAVTNVRCAGASSNIVDATFTAPSDGLYFVTVGGWGDTFRHALKVTSPSSSKVTELQNTTSGAGRNRGFSTILSLQAGSTVTALQSGDTTDLSFYRLSDEYFV